MLTWASRALSRQVLSTATLLTKAAEPQALAVATRGINYTSIDMPKPGNGRNYKYIVKYPKDGKYTTKPLDVIKCGGRDPETGRVVEGKWGGGRTCRYRWIDFDRNGPTEEGVYKEELVIEVQYDPNRTEFIALVGSGSHLRYIIATTDMKAGDIIRSNNFIPEIPGRGTPGDCYALGALAAGTHVCCVEQFPGQGAFYLIHAGETGAIRRRTAEGKIVVRLTERHEVALDPTCSAVVGQVSNPDGPKIHTGSAARLRWLGHRPASGLWQRKQGYHGRKIRPPPPCIFPKKLKEKRPEICMVSKTEGPQKRIIPRSDRVS